MYLGEERLLLLPWPAAVRGKPRRVMLRRAVFSDVKIWFQNRRMKWRNSKERELLASGGSRDQTLPNKNNPNPDLSDPEDRKTCGDIECRIGEMDMSSCTSPASITSSGDILRGGQILETRRDSQGEDSDDEEIKVLKRKINSFHSEFFKT
uniref:Homeobox domain-containing protein n=1 Tax=Strigamia maritima TaxID=126957 RepID=T1JEX4_STRMM